MRVPPRRHALLLAAGVHFGMGGSILGTVIGLGATIVHLPDPPEGA